MSEFGVTGAASRDTWLIASGNAHKVREIAAVLAPFGIDLRSPTDVGIALDVDEWGDTFAENAAIKAIAYAQVFDGPVIADDSGLEVRGLDWAPGVYSARFAGPGATDEDNNQKLIEAIAPMQSEGREARYRCVICTATPSGDAGGGGAALEAIERSEFRGIGEQDERRIGRWTVRTYAGTMSGAIAPERRGSGGFGYDPYFCLADGRHVAELRDAEKNAMSHRGEAVRGLEVWLAAQRG